MISIILWSTCAFIGVVGALAAAFLIWRTIRLRQNTKALAIDTPNGVDEDMFVKIGGIEQWITIRGHDRNNPVMLFLHGGPGAPLTPLGGHRSFLRWEKEFTMVQWDQRGSGKTFGKAGRYIEPDLTIERMVQDGIEVAEFVRRRFHRDRIILVGLSWGTVLGIQMAKARPDLFHAYAGIGQVVHMQKGEAAAYRRVLEKARARGRRKAIRQLEKIGPPPYVPLKKFYTQRRWAFTFEPGIGSPLSMFAGIPCTPRYSFRDLRDWMAGTNANMAHFFGEQFSGPMMSVDLTELGPDFEIPIFIFQGAEDDFTPAEIAKSHFDGINAPEKEFVLLEDRGHNVTFTDNERLLEAVAQRVGPLADARGSESPLRNRDRQGAVPLLE